MRNTTWMKTLTVTAASGALLIGGAGMASADSWDSTQHSADETQTEVNGNTGADGGDLNLGDVANDAVDLGGVANGDIASGNNVLNGVDADVSEILNGTLSGNDVDSDIDPNVDADTDANAEGSVDNTSESTTETHTDDDHNEGLLGGLL